MHDYERYIYVSNNKKIELTVLENEILHILVQNKEKVVTYETMSKNVYNVKYDSSIKVAILNLISRLRKKGINIINKRGFGFVICENN